MASRFPSDRADVEGAQEATPLSQSRPETPAMRRVVFFATLMIGCSVMLINYNKFLMTGVFPFAMHLVLIHTVTGTLFASALYYFVPSLFPSLSDSVSGVQVDRELVMGKALPVAIAFAGTLVLSNMAYQHASVAFLQFMKEGNVIGVYCLSLIAGLECFRCQSLSILLFIMVATTLCVHGEMHFSLLGFVIQGMSQVFEVTRIVLQALLLTASGTKLDAMSYNLIVLPLCFVVLFSSLLLIRGFQAAGMPFPLEIQSPQWKDYVAAAPLLCGNVVVAFALNLSIALFVKNTSAVALVLAGIVKDCCVVSLSLVIFQETITSAQAVGFSMQLMGVFTWSLTKQFPDIFEKQGLFGGMQSVLRKFGPDPKIEML